MLFFFILNLARTELVSKEELVFHFTSVENKKKNTKPIKLHYRKLTLERQSESGHKETEDFNCDFARFVSSWSTGLRSRLAAHLGRQRKCLEIGHPAFDGLMMFTIENNSNWNGKIQCSLGCFPASSYCPVSPLTLGLPPSPHVVITTEKTQCKHEPVNTLWPQCRPLWLELVWGGSDGGLAKAGTQRNDRSRSSAVPKITARQNRMKYARINGAKAKRKTKIIRHFHPGMKGK